MNLEQNTPWPMPEPRKVVIYQHVRKCAGQSFAKACSRWFEMRKDQPERWASAEEVTNFTKSPLDLNALPEKTMLYGHLTRDGIRPLERYGAEFDAGVFTLITVVRDPLEQAISSYFYRIRNGKPWGEPLDIWLRRRRDNICKFLGVRCDGGLITPNPFAFIGVTEQLQQSLDILAHMTGNSRVEVERVNVTPRDDFEISDETREIFRERNRMDQALYEYSCDRLTATAEAFGLVREPAGETRADG